VLETLGFIVQIALTGVEDLMVTGISPYPGTVIFDRLLRKAASAWTTSTFEACRS
jgi:hypothetical protein